MNRKGSICTSLILLSLILATACGLDETVSTPTISPTLTPEPPSEMASAPLAEPEALEYVSSPELCEVTWRLKVGGAPGQQPMANSSPAGDGALRRFQGDGPSVGLAQFMPDGHTILIYSSGVTRFWDAATGAELAILEDASGKGSGRPVVSPGGQFIAARTGEGTLSLWDAQSGRLQRTLSVTGESPTFSPDGRLLATGDMNIVTLWDVATGDKRMVLQGHIVAGAEYELAGDTMAGGHAGPVSGLAFSPDGQVLLSGGSDGTIRLWDVADGRHRWCAVVGSIDSLSFRPDGRRFLVVSSTSIRLWDALYGSQRWEKAVPTLGRDEMTGIRSAVFSPDGASILTAHGDTTARIWNATTGKLTGLLRHPQVVNHAAYDPAGDLIITALGDASGFFSAPPLGEAWLWPADHPDHRLAAEAQKMIDAAVAQAKAGEFAEAEVTLAQAQALNPYPDYDLSYEGGQWVTLALTPQLRELVDDDDVDGALSVVAGLNLLEADIHLPARTLAELCYAGIVTDRAADVLTACDLAVDVSHEYELPIIRSIRGVARALTGDVAGAIEDLQFFVEANADRSYLEDAVNRRLEWLSQLQAGQNPFEGDVESILR